jgi:starch phosphorylase
MANENGKSTARWEGGEIVQAVAHDVPIPGFDTKNTINIRLWRSVPKKVNCFLKC